MKSINIKVLNLLLILFLIFCPSLKVNASEDLGKVAIKVKMENVEMMNNGKYNVKGGEQIVVRAKTTNGAPIAFIGYCFKEEGNNSIIDVYSDTLTISVPKGEAGTTKTLLIEAVSSEDDGTPNTITKTGWQKYTLVYPEEEKVEVGQVEMTVKLEGKAIKNNGKYEVKGGEKIIVNATTTNGAPIAFIGYYFKENGSNSIIDVYSDTLTITLPKGEAGTTKTLYIEAVSSEDDGTPNTITKTGWQKYTLVYPEEEKVELGKTEMTVKMGNVTMVNNGKYNVKGGEQIVVRAKTTNGTPIAFIGYYFKEDGGNSVVDVHSDALTITVPKGEVGTTKTLLIEAVSSEDDGKPNTITKTGWQKYTFVYPEEEKEEVCQVEMTVKMGNTKMVNNGKYNVKGGEKVTVKAKSSVTDIAFISYYFSTLEKDNMANKIVVDSDEIEITIPKEKDGTILILSIESVAKNDNGKDNTITKTGWQNYALIYPEEQKEEKLEGRVWVRIYKTILKENSTTTYDGDFIVIGSQGDIDKIYYKWDNGKETELEYGRYNVSYDINDNEIHTLYVRGILTDGSEIETQEYYFKREEPEEKTDKITISNKILQYIIYLLKITKK